MQTLIIEVATDEEFNARIVRAVERNEPQPPGYFFNTEESLFNTLTADRFAIIKALAGAPPIDVGELAQRVGRDVNAVSADAKHLAGIGLIDKTETGQFHFPYDGVQIQIRWQAAA